MGRVQPKPWCRIHEHRALSVEILGEELRSQLKEELAELVEPRWLTGCWLWTGEKNRDGYGIYRSRPARVGRWTAHRFSWLLFNEGHRVGEELSHECQTRECVSPFHLAPVSSQENASIRDDVRRHPGAPEEDRAAFLPLYVFAALHGLPLKNGRVDYSKPWQPAGAVHTWGDDE